MHQYIKFNQNTYLLSVLLFVLRIYIYTSLLFNYNIK